MQDRREFGFDGYTVSESGEVCGPLGRPIRFYQTAKGYMQQSIRGKTVRLHRAVAAAFVPNPDNLPEVNHIDGNKLNNHASNLEWTTRKGNMRHAYATGLAKNGFGDESSRSILTSEQVAYIRAVHKPADKEFGQTALGRKFGVTNSCVWRVVHGSNWSAA